MSSNYLIFLLQLELFNLNNFHNNSNLTSFMVKSNPSTPMNLMIYCITQ